MEPTAAKRPLAPDMLKHWRQKRRNCTADEARFLLLLCLGRDPHSEAEINAYLDRGFFASLKQLLAGPVFTQRVFAPLALGRHPMQIAFTPDQANLVQRCMKATLGIKAGMAECQRWPQVLGKALGAKRMAKAFLSAHSPKELTDLQDRLATNLPCIQGAGYHDGVDFIHGFAERQDTNAPLTLEFVINDTVVGTTIADKPNPHQSAQLDLRENTGFRHTLDLSSIGQPKKGSLFIFDAETGIMICPPRDMIFDVELANTLVAQMTKDLDALRASESQDAETKKAIATLERELHRVRRFADIPLADYAVYKALYQPLAVEVDKQTCPRIAVVMMAETGASLRRSLKEQTYKDFEVFSAKQANDFDGFDCVIPFHGNEELHPHTLQGYVAALSDPQTQVLRAGFDHVSDAGDYSNPMFPGSFDPLLLAQIPGYASALAFRATALSGPEDLQDISSLLNRLYTQHGSAGFKSLDDILVSIPKQNTAMPMAMRLPVPPPDQKLAIIIPTRDRLDLLKPCLESLEKTVQAPNATEVVIIDNDSSEPDILEWLKQAERDCSAQAIGVKVLRYDKPFNWAAMNNYAASNCDADLLLFLNNDTLATEKGWDQTLRSLLAMPDVGAVGARLLFEDNTVQHGGIIIGSDGEIRHEGMRQAADAHLYQHRLQITRRCEAVTGAFLACSYANFDRIGGFDASAFPVTYNDIDFCLSLSAHGKATVYSPLITFYHLESRSRGYDAADTEKQKRKRAEKASFLEKWPSVAKGDRWFPHQLRYGHYGNGILIKSPLINPDAR